MSNAIKSILSNDIRYLTISIQPTPHAICNKVL